MAYLIQLSFSQVMTIFVFRSRIVPNKQVQISLLDGVTKSACREMETDKGGMLYDYIPLSLCRKTIENSCKTRKGQRGINW